MSRIRAEVELLVDQIGGPAHCRKKQIHDWECCAAHFVVTHDRGVRKNNRSDENPPMFNALASLAHAGVVGGRGPSAEG